MSTLLPVVDRVDLIEWYCYFGSRLRASVPLLDREYQTIFCESMESSHESHNERRTTYEKEGNSIASEVSREDGRKG